MIVFASALLDILSPGKTTPPPVNAAQEPTASAFSTPVASSGGQLTLLSTLEDLPESKGKEAILTLVRQAEGDITKTRQGFESWYDAAMDRAVGWYKRKTQLVLFAIGLIVAVGLNMHSIYPWAKAKVTQLVTTLQRWNNSLLILTKPIDQGDL